MRSLATAALVGLASASPAHISDYIRAAGDTPLNSRSFGNVTATNGTTSQEPCAIVNQQWLASDSRHLVDAELAYQCLKSVPLHVEEGILQVEGIKTSVQFQSTLAFLERPTQGYIYPAVDIEGGLDKIIDKLKASGYTTEYDLQLDIYSLIRGAYDGHFVYTPDMFGVFGFGLRLPLYSISQDGIALPEVYFGNDTHYLSGKFGRNATISPVSQINGQDVETYLNQVGLSLTYQDPDASYNALFLTGLKVASGFDQLIGREVYPGKSTVITHRNGTTQTIKTIGTVGQNVNFTAVVDGQSFYDTFCTQYGQESAYNQTLSQEDEPSPTSSAHTTIPTTQVPFEPLPANTSARYLTPPTYPKPIVTNDDGSISGFFPAENPDLAVLTIPTFNPANAVQFANVVRIFLASAQAAGKKKLMIDIRGNGGGMVALAYDLFGQLFPKLVPYGATNFRATQLLNDTGYIVSDFYSNVTNATVSPDEGCHSYFNIHPFNYREQLDENDQPFTSWSDYFGPHEHNKDNFTSLSRYNLADRYSLFCLQTSNYGNLTGITPQVFQPENVVLVQDGQCGSTCAVFTEFMKAQAKVKQVVFGGRKQTGPMQGVGAVKGANVYPFNIVDGLVYRVESTYADEEDERTPYIEKYKNITAGMDQALLRAANDPKGYPAKLAKINIRNNIRYGDESATPLQFVYEAADCRLFYTASMVAQQSAVWAAAYAARWSNGTCVAGSTGHPSSAPDSDAIFPAPESARNLFGADASIVFPTDLNATTTTGSQEPTATATATPSAPAATVGAEPSFSRNCDHERGLEWQSSGRH